MGERLKQGAIDNNENVSNRDGSSDGLPRMSEVLTAPVITAIHKDEAVIGYREALRQLRVPEKDIIKNSDQVELKLAPLSNGQLRRGLTPVYAAARAGENFKSDNGRMDENLSSGLPPASTIEISE